MRIRAKGELKNALYILAGLCLCVLGYALFLVPNGIAAGGFTGVAQLLNHALGLPIGATALAMNVPLFLLSIRSMGMSFVLRSLVAALAFSMALDTLPLPAPVQDVWLATVYGGLLSGAGFGLVLRGSATTGGTEMLASLLHRVIPPLRVSVGIFLVDGLVILASAFVFDATRAMYALICTFIANLMVDLVLEGPNSSHAFFIISDRSEEIARRILAELDRGVTALDGRGMYSGAPKQVLLCAVSRMETVTLRRVVYSIDPAAFIITMKSHETYGEGFKSLR